MFGYNFYRGNNWNFKGNKRYYEKERGNKRCGKKKLFRMWYRGKKEII